MNRASRPTPRSPPSMIPGTGVQSAEQTFDELIPVQELPAVADMIDSLRPFIGANQMMAYLVMMAARLVELHRVLKPTGSLYLHCDPTASHYLKMMLDTMFGSRIFEMRLFGKRTMRHKLMTKDLARYTTRFFFLPKSRKYYHATY